MYVFGPETHMTAICGMALGTRPIPQENNVEFATANFLLPSGDKSDKAGSSSKNAESDKEHVTCSRAERVSPPFRFRSSMGLSGTVVVFSFCFCVVH